MIHDRIGPFGPGQAQIEGAVGLIADAVLFQSRVLFVGKIQGMLADTWEDNVLVRGSCSRRPSFKGDDANCSVVLKYGFKRDSHRRGRRPLSGQDQDHLIGGCQ